MLGKLRLPVVAAETKTPPPAPLEPVPPALMFCALLMKSTDASETIAMLPPDAIELAVMAVVPAADPDGRENLISLTPANGRKLTIVRLPATGVPMTPELSRLICPKTLMPLAASIVTLPPFKVALTSMAAPR